MIKESSRWFCDLRDRELNCRKVWCEYDCPYADFVRTLELMDSGVLDKEAMKRVIRTAWPKGVGKAKVEDFLGMSTEYVMEVLTREEDK